MSNTYPSKDPADEGSLAGTMRSVFNKLMQGAHGQLPAIVQSYDRVRNVASVRPLVQVMSTDRTLTPRAVVASVPVLAIGGGGFVINFPLKVGDLGWIEASDRDISLFLQSLSDAGPNTERLHDFKDGRFIPDVFRKYTVSGDDADAMVVQSLDGSVRLALAPGQIRMTAPNTTINSNVDINGILRVNGVVVNEHTHPGIQPGNGTTGPMQ